LTPPRPIPPVWTDLRLKLTWVSIFRTVATTLMLAAMAVRVFAAPPRGRELSAEDSASLFVIAAVYLATLAYGVMLKRGLVGRGLAYAQIVGDVALASGLVYLTGGADSPFTFSYLLAIVLASTLLYRRGALFAAMGSTVAFTALALAVQHQLLRSPSGTGILPPGRLGFLVVSNVLAQFLIAVLAGYLSHQLSAAGGRLSKREADLREMASLQRQILASVPSGLASCEADGAVIFMNRAACSILGVTEASGRNIEEIIPGIRRRQLGSKRFELSVETPAGQRTLGLALTALEGEDGPFLVIFQDLTDLRRAEAELQRIDRLAALGRLAAQLAHEIRNPLASMRGSAQMIAGTSEGNGSSAKLASILVREADRLSTLVENFLRFARPPPPTLRHQSLRKIVVDTLEVLSADPLSRGVSINPSLAEIFASVDADQLTQALINILRNAFVAAGPSGEVRIVLEHLATGPRIRIWDSAGSIPPSDLNRIFEPFFTTREGGTGLGLSTAHSIIRAHGGTISVTSSPAHGTEFTLSMPPVKEVAVGDPGR
jgi:two-component system sensor histidine kinase PilS (NtrC family)